jgi:VanZ family protein
MALTAVSFCRRPEQLAWLAVLTVALGGAFEYAQSLVPYRSAEFADTVADAAGGLAGYGAALLILYFVIRPAESRVRAGAR